MNRILALLLSCAMLLTGCAAPERGGQSNTNMVAPRPDAQEVNPSLDACFLEEPSFTNLDDPGLLQYVEDSIYADLAYQFGSDDYFIENVTTTYVSKEYLEELAYNSQENIYFGYTLSEIEAQFEGKRYVFSLGENGQTVVHEFQAYDDTFNQVIQDIAIGTGVIFVCVTVSVVSAGVGASAVSMIFAASAKTGAAFALSSGTISTVSAGIVTGIQTQDFNKALKSAASVGSEAFKWGAITGVIAGGAAKAVELHRTTSATIPTPREAELKALEHYGGSEQCSYINGQEVPWGTPGSTRPDVVRTVNNHLEAIEVKNYNLTSPQSRSTLYSELNRQVTSRLSNLPEGSTQRIVLNTEGRNFPTTLTDDVVANIRYTLQDVYPDIPIDIMR